jgi:hypothetical protein
MLLNHRSVILIGRAIILNEAPTLAPNSPKLGAIYRDGAGRQGQNIQIIQYPLGLARMGWDDSNTLQNRCFTPS